jgi:integrase
MIVSGSEWLFPATRGGGAYTGANVDERLGVGCHMLRRSFASFCIQSGVDLIYTKSLLNHSTSADVSMNSYISLSPVKRLEAAQRVSDFISAASLGQGEVKALTWQGDRAEGEMGGVTLPL